MRCVHLESGGTVQSVVLNSGVMCGELFCGIRGVMC